MKKILMTSALVLGLAAAPAMAATVTSTTGNVDISNIALLGTTAHDDLNTEAGSIPNFFLFEEQSKILSASDVSLINANNNGALLATTAAEGDTVTSFIFAMMAGSTASVGSVTFSGNILGIFTSAGHSSGPITALQNTDADFGIAGVTYDQPLNPTFRGTLEQSSESITVSGAQVDWDLLNGGAAGLEQFRVIVASPAAVVPLPAGLPLLVGGLAGLGLLSRRRRPI